MHLFACRHPKMMAVQEKLSLYIAKSLHDYGNSELLNILEIGLLFWISRNSSKVPKAVGNLRTKLRKDTDSPW
jgi:hypothetical protein